MKSGSEAFRHRGRRLVGVWATPETKRFPAVLFLHGFPGSEQNVDIRRALLKKGVASFALHFSGAWGSDGLYRFTTLVDDARAGLRFMASLPGVDKRRLAVFGFSMGGWTAIHLAAREPGLKAVAAVAPVGGPEMNHGKKTWEKIRYGGRVLRIGSAEALHKDFVRAVTQGDPASSAARLKAPLLLVHGTGDATIPHPVSLRIYASAAGEKRLVLMKGAAHDFLDRREKLTALVSGWLARRVA